MVIKYSEEKIFYRDENVVAKEKKKLFICKLQSRKKLLFISRGENVKIVVGGKLGRNAGETLIEEADKFQWFG